jgi:hypothetical protein
MDENRANLAKVAIDKNIVSIASNEGVVGTEMPPGILGAPIDVNPHAHNPGPARTSTNAHAEVAKLGDAQRAGMREYLNRKV